MINENPIDNYSNNSSDKLNQRLKELQEENAKLQYQLNIHQSKESLHKTTMEKVKQIQDDYESTYQEIYNDFKQREAKIKEQYHQFSSKLQSESSQREEKLLEQIKDIKAQLDMKNELIAKQQADLVDIIEKNSKNEITFHLKEKDYEALIVSKERKQAELEQAVKSISLEASEKIQSLSKQLDDFQSKLQNTITLEDESEQDDGGFGNVNNINTNSTKRDLLMNANEINNSLRSLEISPLKKGGQSQYQCPNDCVNKLKEKEREIHALKIENERLYNENLDKDQEIALLKEVKQELKPMQYSTMKYQEKDRNNQMEYRPYNEYSINDYRDRKGSYEKVYSTTNKEINESKQEYQPIHNHNLYYKCHEYIPLPSKIKHSINDSAINRSAVMKASNIHKSYMTTNTPKNKDYNNNTTNRSFNVSTLALKHDTSMKQLHIKIQALRNKLIG